MSTRWSRFLLIAVPACLLALPALAQTSTTGLIEGRVRDQAGNPIKEATVSAVANRAPASAVVDAQGRYTIANLPPGTYKVRAEAPGKAAVVQDEIVVSINTRTHVDFTLASGQTETVTVTAESPTIDTKSVTTGGTFKVEGLIDQIPVGRNLASTLTLAPGVASGLGTGSGNYAISGSSGLENSYIVDGVNITNTGYGGIGSYNIVYGSLGTGVTYDFLEEVQVKTGGIDAEYGQATGGVINSVVKTGTNDLSGAVALYGSGYTNDFEQADLFVGATNNARGTWNDNAQYDLGLSVGGPILKDKLFYFVAYNPVKTKSSAAVQAIPLPSTISNGNPALTKYDPPATYPASVGIETQSRMSNNYAGKFTWYATPNHRLELTAFGDPSTGDSGPQRIPTAADGASALKNIDIFTTGGGLSSIDYGGNNYSLKYDAVFTPTFFLQAQVGRHDGKFDETSALNASRYTDQRQLRCFLSPAFCTPGQSRANAATWNVGGVGFISNQTDINNQAKFLLTWVAGNNELKGGASYDQIRYTDAQDYTGPDIPIHFIRAGAAPAPGGAINTPCPASGPPYPTDCYVLLDTRGGVTASARQSASTGAINFRATRGRYSPDPGPTQTDDVAVFLQDTFTFAHNFTLKAGVRASQQKIKGSGDYSLQFYYDDGLRTPESATAPALAGHYTFDCALAPRVGLTWDTKGDGRSKLYVNAARYYERVPNDLAIRALSNEADLGTTIFNNWDPLSGPTPGSQTNGGGIRGGQTSVLAGTKLPYTDEYVIGWQQELGRDVSYEIRGIYREEGRALEDTQFNTVEATENYYIQYYLGAVGAAGINQLPFPTYPSAPFDQYILANPGENTPAGFPKAIRKYHALEAILNKRFSDHWLFYGNMRFSRLTGNYEGLFRNDNGQSDPNVTSLFDFPNSGLLAGQFQPGVLNTDVPFAMKLYGSYTMDNGVSLGAALNVSAGTPRTPLLAHPNGFYQNAGEVPGKDPVYYWYSNPAAPGSTVAPCGSVYCLQTGSPTQFFNDKGAYNVGSWAFPHLYSYDLVNRGFLGRTATQTSLDLSANWSKNFNRWATFGVGITVFNVLNAKETILNDDDVELQAGVTDPDYLSPIQFQLPRSVRVFAKWSF